MQLAFGARSPEVLGIPACSTEPRQKMTGAAVWPPAGPPV
jgi:hypothetical protein